MRRDLLAWMVCYRLKALRPHLPWYARLALLPSYAVARWYSRGLPEIQVVSADALAALKNAYREPKGTGWGVPEIRA